MCIFCEKDARSVGTFFGYPKCCIDWYINQQETYGKGSTENLTKYQWEYLEENDVAAFMPCPQHARKIIRKGINPANILINRKASLQFPFQDEETELKFEKYLKEI